MNKIGAFCFSVVSVLGQSPIAPTDAPVGSRRGQDINGYNITNSFELGYRWRSVGGDLGKYRSDVNYNNGFQLLSGSLSVNSKEGHGKYFDELLLNTQGLGADPYQYSSLRIQKNKLYKFDMLWRQTDYYNPALPITFGQHFMDTTRRLHDYQILLLPESAFRITAGYSRNSQSGPALITQNLFDQHRGDEFPLFSNVRRLQDEYRIGFDARIFGVRIFAQRGWEFFRDDSVDNSGLLVGNNPSDLTQLTSFRRSQPYHGQTGNWRVNLLYDTLKWINVNGRFTYAGTRRNFIYDENAIGQNRLGAAQNRQVYVIGVGRRPVLAANLTTVLNPAGALSVVNHTAVHSTRMDGDGTYTELNNGTGFGSLIHFQYLGIRTVSTDTVVNYKISPVVGLFGGYQFSNRRIRSIEQLDFGGTSPDRISSEQENTLHSGRFGVRLYPLKALLITADGEIGRADKPIYSTSEKDYHALGARIRYKTRYFAFGAFMRTNYNFNSTSLMGYSSKSRTYSADLSWNAKSWIGVDASYSKLHLDTLTGLAYFANNAFVDNDYSRYISNIHSGNIGVRLSAGPRVELFVGYIRSQDAGSDEPNRGQLGFQTYPLTFDSPMGRLSIRLHERLRWNAGYQHYGYNEELFPAQNYRAHTGYTSVSWSF